LEEAVAVERVVLEELQLVLQPGLEAIEVYPIFLDQL
jgi:hypothetical protein